MPHDQGLPQTGDSQEIGQDAYDCLRAKRPKNWHLSELGGINDFGFDLQVQISVRQQVVHPFRIQLKGTRSPQRSADGSFLSINLSTTTLRYFDNTDEPVLLVLCDLSVDPEDPRECPLHYVWVREELDRIQIASISLDQKEAAIRVPTANVLDRTTDLVDEVRKRHRLSRVGHALDTSVAGMDPSLGSEDRVVMVEAITRNIGTRSIVFAQALAEPTTDVWINPPRDSLAWLLTEAKSAVASGNVDKCTGLLRQASERLEPASALEKAEYWYLTGRLHIVGCDDDGASRAFKSAAETQPHAKYWAAWAESEMRRRFRTDQGQDYSDVLDALPAVADPVLLSVKARLLAASRKRAEANRAMSKWLSWARRSRLEPFKRLALTLKEHFGGVVRGMLDGRSNAYVEAMNGLLQQTKTAARGFRNIENFIAMAYLRMSKLKHLPQNPLVPAIARDYGRYRHVC